MDLLRAFALAAAAAFPATGLWAGMPTESLVRTFASCEGRLTAETRHSFIADAQAAIRADAEREMFASLVDAVRPDAEAEGLGRYRALGWRITAGVAQDRLRRRAEIGPDRATRRHGRALAEAHVAACRMLIPGA